jgi:hypothetical protein
MPRRVNTRNKGRRNELKAKELLERLGYAVALTPMPQKFNKEQDFFGLFDIIAIGPGGVRLVQVKTNRKPSRTYAAGLAAFRCPASVRKEIWIYKDRQKDPIIIDLGIKTDVTT